MSPKSWQQSKSTIHSALKEAQVNFLQTFFKTLLWRLPTVHCNFNNFLVMFVFINVGLTDLFQLNYHHRFVLHKVVLMAKGRISVNVSFFLLAITL